MLATVLWLLATAGFAWLQSLVSRTTISFTASLGTVIVLLVWLYLIACIALIGCEFNAESEVIDALPSLY